MAEVGLTENGEYARWEYNVLTSAPYPLQPHALNNFGKLGWELVSSVACNDGWVYTFKRRTK